MLYTNWLIFRYVTKVSFIAKTKKTITSENVCVRERAREEENT